MQWFPDSKVRSEELVCSFFFLLQVCGYVLVKKLTGQICSDPEAE